MARARTFLTMVGIGFVLLVGAIPTARAGVAPEACCRPGQPCIDLPPEMCTGRSLGAGTTCAANGAECNVPTVGEWGLVVMTLAVLIAGTIVLRRSEYVASPCMGGAGQSRGRKPADHARATLVSPDLRPVL